MRKILYFVRHGQAESSFGASSDKNRQLTISGRQKVHELSSLIAADVDGLPDLVLCSDAVRTLQTLEILKGTLNKKNHEEKLVGDLYTANSEQMGALIAEQDDSCHSILLIGHNPTISDFVTSVSKIPVAFSPGECMKLTLACESWVAVSSEVWEMTEL